MAGADVSSIAVDRENTLLLCGDAAGWVAIRDISRLDATQPSTASTISLVNKWCVNRLYSTSGASKAVRSYSFCESALLAPLELCVHQ